MGLADDVEFEKVATASEYFSGADLQSLLYTAQINAMEMVLIDGEVCIVTDLYTVFLNHLNILSRNLVSIPMWTVL